MLGTPNHGSFAIPQTITGLEGMVRKLALADLRHDLGELLPVFNSFLGSYQMLPSPLVEPPLPGALLAVIAYDAGAKLATRVRFPLTVKV